GARGLRSASGGGRWLWPGAPAAACVGMMAIYASPELDMCLAHCLLGLEQRARLQVRMEADSERSPDGLAIRIFGTDTLIEALPARPIQLANACSELGFDLAIPLSW